MIKRIITAKARKELDRRFGKLAVSMPGYHDHIDFRFLDDINDEAFAYLMENVKGVNMLDLNGTDITNESIGLLTGLEYINEIRAKECDNLDNDCVDDLNKLSSLVFLHLKNTNITIDGLLKLKNLTNLKTLMFSADDIGTIKDKLLQLKATLLHCELVINSKPYLIDAIDLFIYTLKARPFKYRLKIKNQPITEDWSSWLGQPYDNYIEAENQGSYSVHDIEWVDIISREKRMEGDSNTVKDYGHSAAKTKLLEDLEFPFMITDDIISVYLLKKEI